MNAFINGSKLTKQAITFVVLIYAIRLTIFGVYFFVNDTGARQEQITHIMEEAADWITPIIDSDSFSWGLPSLLSWLSTLFFYLFGINEAFTRVIHFCFGTGILFLTYRFSKKVLAHKESAWLSVAILLSCVFFVMMTGIVIKDTIFAFGMILGMFSFWMVFHEEHYRRWGYVFLLSLVIGTLGQGVTFFLIIGATLCCWLTVNQRWPLFFSRIPWGQGFILFSLLLIPYQGTPDLLSQFIVGEHFKLLIIGGFQTDLYAIPDDNVMGVIWIFIFIATQPWLQVLSYQWVKFKSKLSLSSEESSGNNTEYLSFLLSWLLVPLFVLTFSRTISISSILVVLPALALCIGYYHLQVPISSGLLKIGVVTPIVLVGVLFVLQDKVDLQLEENLFQAWKADSKEHSSKLYYIGSSPFSSKLSFMGQAQKIESLEDIPLIEKKSGYFVVLSKKRKNKTISDECTRIAKSKRRILLYCQSE